MENVELDLVEQMEWEDCEKVEFISLEDAGLEVRDYDTIPNAQRTYYYIDEGEI